MASIPLFGGSLYHEEQVRGLQAYTQYQKEMMLLNRGSTMRGLRNRIVSSEDKTQKTFRQELQDEINRWLLD